MYSKIVLFGVHSKQVRIDFFSTPIRKRFSGFQEVPIGIHYINVKKDNDNYPNFWCHVRAHEIVVKVIHAEALEFEDMYPEQEQNARELVEFGALDNDLVPYDHKKWGSWLLLTRHIQPPYFPVALHPSPQSLIPSQISPLDWEKELFEIHQGDHKSFLSEFQFAFISWFVSDLDCPKTDVEAFNRWNYLVEALGNAERESLVKTPQLIDLLADSLIWQFESLDDTLLPANDPLIRLARRLQAKMLESDISVLLSGGENLKDYLDQRYGNLTA